MTNRTERHFEMAEAAIRAHQALTEAHVAGHEPVATAPKDASRKVTLYTPQLGEHEVDDNVMAGSEGSLRELRMFWQRIPDFGVKSYEVFASEAGWAQVLYWSGTGLDGATYDAQEVDVVRTDDAFNITRFEIYSDGKQWLKLVEYANDKSARDLPSYDKILEQF
jgi:hypothetical protein